MAGKTVIQHECQRCPRVWYSEPKPEGEGEVRFTAKLVVAGKMVVDVSWDDLCETCQKVVSSVVTQLTKGMRHRAPSRGAKKPEGAPAPPVPTAKPVIVSTAERTGTRASGHSNTTS